MEVSERLGTDDPSDSVFTLPEKVSAKFVDSETVSFCSPKVVDIDCEDGESALFTDSIDTIDRTSCAGRANSVATCTRAQRFDYPLESTLQGYLEP